MKLMKPLLLLAGLGLSCTVKAQLLAPKEVKPAKPFDLVEAIENSPNPRYKVLKSPTPVYRQPADTLSGRYAHKLLPGMKVYIKKYLPQGFTIRIYSSGGEEYYLPHKYVAGLPTYVEI